MSQALPESAPPAFIHTSGDFAEVVNVYDDVDIATADALWDSIRRAIDAAGGRPVVVDLTNCKYIDSRGLLQLTKAHRALGSHRFWVVLSPTGFHRRLFDITGLFGLINTAMSIDDIPQA